MSELTFCHFQENQGLTNQTPEMLLCVYSFVLAAPYIKGRGSFCHVTVVSIATFVSARCLRQKFHRHVSHRVFLGKQVGYAQHLVAYRHTHTHYQHRRCEFVSAVCSSIFPHYIVQVLRVVRRRRCSVVV